MSTPASQPACRSAPAPAACCLCNFAADAAQQRQWRALQCDARHVDRVLCPRPQPVGRCTTAAYQPPHTLAKQSVALAPAPRSTTTPGRAAATFETLTAVESRLGGRQQPPSYTLCAPTASAAAAAAPTPTPCSSLAASPPPRPCTTRGCDVLDPARSDAVQGAAWREGTLPYDRLECWQWSDHPFVLNAYGVGRCAAGAGAAAATGAGAGAATLAFDQSTRRKLAHVGGR